MAFYAGNGKSERKDAAITFDIDENGRKHGEQAPTYTGDMLIVAGSHCQHPDCGQLEFLPSECIYCHQTFCASHASFTQHPCPNDPSDSHVMPQCTLCKEYILVSVTDDANKIMKMHHVSGCSSHLLKLSSTDKAMLKESMMCCVSTCNNHNGNMYSTQICRQCRKQVCLKHRFPEDHFCDKKAVNVVGGGSSNTGETAKDKAKGFWSKFWDRIVSPTKEDNSEPLSFQVIDQSVLSPKLQTKTALALPNKSKQIAQRHKSTHKTSDKADFALQLYLPTNQPNGTPIKLSKDVFTVMVNSEYTVGRTLDWFCTQFGLVNTNDKLGKPKLHICSPLRYDYQLRYSTKWVDLATGASQMDALAPGQPALTTNDQGVPAGPGMHISLVWTNVTK